MPLFLLARLAGSWRHPDSLGLRTVSFSGTGIIRGAGGSGGSHGILPAGECGGTWTGRLDATRHEPPHDLALFLARSTSPPGRQKV